MNNINKSVNSALKQTTLTSSKQDEVPKNQTQGSSKKCSQQNIRSTISKKPPQIHEIINLEQDEFISNLNGLNTGQGRN